jgi:hypothetical protein
MIIKERFEAWLNGLKSDLIKSYKSKGLEASGQWEKDLQIEITEKQNTIQGKIFGSYYTYWLENGRGKNKNQDPKKIRGFVQWAGSTFLSDWCEAKGIEKSLAYAIAYKIAREGYKPKHVVSDVINDKLVNSFKEEIKTWYVAKFESEILKKAKDIEHVVNII